MQEIMRKNLISGTEYYFEEPFTEVDDEDDRKKCNRFIGTFLTHNFFNGREHTFILFEKVRCANPDKQQSVINSKDYMREIPGRPGPNYRSIYDVMRIHDRDRWLFYERNIEKIESSSNKRLYTRALEKVLEEVTNDPFMAKVESTNFLNTVKTYHDIDQKHALSQEDKQKESLLIKQFVRDHLSKSKPASGAEEDDTRMNGGTRRKLKIRKSRKSRKGRKSRKSRKPRKNKKSRK